MFDIDAEIKKIEACSFFSNMGEPGVDDDETIYIADVESVFIEPSEVDFNGRYNETEWLPSAPSQNDPFYTMPPPPKDLADIRIRINKAIMAATRNIDKKRFLSRQHDFSIAARNAICFAFRQYASECYFGAGNKWSRVVSVYYLGRWPVGYYKDGLVVI